MTYVRPFYHQTSYRCPQYLDHRHLAQLHQPQKDTFELSADKGRSARYAPFLTRHIPFSNLF